MDIGCSEGKFPEFQFKRDWQLIWHELKKGNFREAWKEFRKKKHWREIWKKYKEDNNVFFTKFYG